MSTTPKVWLITGALSGFGRIMAELVLAAGDNCVATSIDPTSTKDLEEQYGSSRILSLHVDVTKPEEISSAFAAAKEHFSGIDVVFNNAGLGLSGVVESVPDAVARKLFEVNFWGSTNVTKEAVRFFRDVNGSERGGRLLVMSSAGGIGAGGFMGHYAASKHGVEAITTAVAHEVKPEWNIQIMIVEPGWMKTTIMSGAPGQMVPCPEAYGGEMYQKSRRALLGTPGDPKAAMEFVHRIAQGSKIPFHLPVGKVAVLSARMMGAMWTKVANDWEEEGCRPEYGEINVPLRGKPT